jgi:hypothetical protein
MPKDRVPGTGPMSRVRVRGTGLNMIMDSEKLHANILAHLASDPMAQKHLGDTDLRYVGKME